MSGHGSPPTPHRDADHLPWVDRAAIGARDPLLLLARILLGAIFAQSGFGKLTDLAGFSAGLEGMGVPMPSVLAVAGAVVECFGGLAIMLGAWTRVAAVLVIGFTAIATLLAHRFWAVPPEQQAMQGIQFMKNLAIIGGLLALVAAGAGRFGIDGGLRRRDRT